MKTKKPPALAKRAVGEKRGRSQSPERGSAMIEAGLVLTVFLLLVVALFDFGRLVWTYQTLGFAARHGARVAMIRGAQAAAGEVELAIEQHAPGLGSADLTVSVVYDDPAMERGSTVRVEATYPFQFVASALWGGAGSLSLKSSIQRVISQ